MPSANTMPGVQETQLADDDVTVASDGNLKPKEAFKIRSYQLEMLEESMKRNIIVAVCQRFLHRLLTSHVSMCLDGYRGREDNDVEVHVNGWLPFLKFATALFFAYKQSSNAVQRKK